MTAAAIPNYFKHKVSKNRRRFKDDTYDLDLTYITNNIIAMAFPAENVQSIYRNNMDHVRDFMEEKHKDHYYIYNLCSERSYDKAKFRNRVKVFPFDDHNPPSFPIIRVFCEDVHRNLQSDPNNIVAVHCKAGKGRTGTMICCYLIHTGLVDTADAAIALYGHKRTLDGRGVTIPSQIRYVRYYEQYIKQHLNYIPTTLRLKRVNLKPAPKLSDSFLLSLKQAMWNNRKDDNRGNQPKKKLGEPLDMEYADNFPELISVIKTADVKSTEGEDEIIIECGNNSLNGDVRFELFSRPPIFTKKKRLARVWFNTYFAEFNRDQEVGERFRLLVFKKNELDIAWKKDRKHKLFPENFELRILLKLPDSDDTVDESETPPKRDSSGAEDESMDDAESVLEKRLSDPQGVGYRILSECEISQLINGEFQ